MAKERSSPGATLVHGQGWTARFCRAGKRAVGWPAGKEMRLFGKGNKSRVFTPHFVASTLGTGAIL
jgi:hypothetical protein